MIKFAFWFKKQNVFLRFYYVKSTSFGFLFDLKLVEKISKYQHNFTINNIKKFKKLYLLLLLLETFSIANKQDSCTSLKIQKKLLKTKTVYSYFRET